MNEFTINYRDNRVENFNKNNFDCFLFDSFKIIDIMSILKGEAIDIKRFLLPEKIEFLQETFNYPDRYILSKASLINSIIQNDPYSRAFLVFQSISWKLAKVKMPYIFIPVRIFDSGLKIVKDGDIFINPLIKKYVDEEVNLEVYSNKIQEIDSIKLNKIISEANGRIVYEMYLTHFKVEYPLMKTRVNKRFIKKNFYTKKDISNKNVIAIDNELTQVFENIREGNNTIVKAKQGTRKLALITNLIANSVDKNKYLLYVSDKNYSSLKSTLQNVNLIPFVFDTNGNNDYEDSLIDSPKFDKRELKDLLDDLIEYEDKYNYKYKGYSFREVFRELIKLEDLYTFDMEVEFFENLTFSDVKKIKETLIKLEEVLTKLNIDYPSNSFWNDCIVREAQSNVDLMVLTTTQLINELKKLNTMLKELNESGFMLPRDLVTLDNILANLDFMNVSNYPISWVESIDNFNEAKSIINRINNVAGRTMSLYTIINSTYNANIFKIDVDDIYNSLYRDIFTVDDNQTINSILSSKKKIKKEIISLSILLERFKIYINYFETNLKMDFDTGLIEFTDSFCKITNKSIFSKQWFNLEKEIIEEISPFIDEVNSFYSDYNVVKNYFKEEALELELEVINNYLKKFNKTSTVDRVEVLNSSILVERRATTNYLAVTRRHKKIITERLKNVILNKDRINEIKLIVLEKIRTDFELELLEEVIETIEDSFYFREKYKDKPGYERLTSDFDKLNLQEINAVYLQFKYDLNEFIELVDNDFYESALSGSFTEMQSNFSNLFNHIENIFEVDYSVKKLFLRPPTKLTVESFKTIRNTISNYNRNKDYLESQEDYLKMLYGDKYKGKDTVFKPIRVSIKNFEKFYNLFKDFDTLKDIYNNKSFKTLYENVYKIGVTLNNIYVITNKIEIYYDVVFKDHSIESRIDYFEKYIDIENLKLWLEYLELNQILRMYGQLRFASNINNGYVRKNLLNSFMKAFFNKLVESYFIKEDNEIILSKMSRFNKLLELRNKSNSNYLRGKYKKNKRNIVLSSISGLKNVKERHFDLVIVDGAEMIHKNYYNKLSSLAKQIVIIGDEQNISITDSVFNLVSDNLVYELKNNYRLSLHLFDKYGSGVMTNQQISINNENKVVAELIRDFKRNRDLKVSVICFNDETRKSMFNNIADKLLRDDVLNEHFYNVIDRVKTLLYTNYIPSSDITYIITDINNQLSLTNTIKSALRNTKVLRIIDVDDILSSKGYRRLKETLITDKVDLFNDVTDEISLKVADLLGNKYTYKKAISPFDLVISKDKEIKALVKITFNMLTDNDILEESHMIYDNEYDRYNKVVISIDDLYFNQEEIVKKLKDVIDCEYGEQN